MKAFLDVKRPQSLTNHGYSFVPDRDEVPGSCSGMPTHRGPRHDGPLHVWNVSQEFVRRRIRVRLVMVRWIAELVGSGCVNSVQNHLEGVATSDVVGWERCPLVGTVAEHDIAVIGIRDGHDRDVVAGLLQRLPSFC